LVLLNARKIKKKIIEFDKFMNEVAIDLSSYKNDLLPSVKVE